MIYSLQLDRHANAIVCAGTRERAGYSIVHTGTYDECNAARPAMVAEARRAKHEANYARLGMTFTDADAAFCAQIDGATDRHAARNRINWNGTTRNA
jgi:hypothetical protein